MKMTAMRMQDWEMGDMRQCKHQEVVQTLKTPKRLRGAAQDLIKRMRRSHTHCHYAALIEHYCPLSATVPIRSEASYTSMVTPAAQVSAFCRAVLARVIPKDMLGGDASRAKLMRSIDVFVYASKYEKFSLQNAFDGMKVTRITWLRPRNIKPTDHMSTSDCEKRLELLAELIYWIFDGFIIPLIHSNFYVTESSGTVAPNALLYFRHDVWHRLSKPAFASLKTLTYEHVPHKEAQFILHNRELNHSKIRLMPKKDGLRCITNMKRKPIMHGPGGRRYLGKSVNDVLKIDFNVLKFESVSLHLIH